MHSLARLPPVAPSSVCRCKNCSLPHGSAVQYGDDIERGSIPALHCPGICCNSRSLPCCSDSQPTNHPLAPRCPLPSTPPQVFVATTARILPALLSNLEPSLTRSRGAVLVQLLMPRCVPLPSVTELSRANTLHFFKVWSSAVHTCMRTPT